MKCTIISLEKLKAFFEKHPFENKSAEIEFFKLIKPQLACKLNTTTKCTISRLFSASHFKDYSKAKLTLTFTIISISPVANVSLGASLTSMVFIEAYLICGGL